MRNQVDSEEQVLTFPEQVKYSPKKIKPVKSNFVIFALTAFLLVGFLILGIMTINCMKGNEVNGYRPPEQEDKEHISDLSITGIASEQIEALNPEKPEKGIANQANTQNQDIIKNTDKTEDIQSTNDNKPKHEISKGNEAVTPYSPELHQLNLQAEQVGWIRGLNDVLKQEQKQRQERGIMPEDKLIPITLNLLSGDRKLPYHFVEIKTFPSKQPHSTPPILELKDIQKIKKSMPPTNETFFSMAKKLRDNFDDPYSLQLQYYIYDTQEKISEIENEKGICVVSAGRNFLKSPYYQKLFVSVSSQNYTNFKLVVTDDASTDNSFSKLSELIQNQPNLHGRTTLLLNYQRRGALANRDIMVRNFCSEGDIIVDIDADDYLLGKQVFKLLNSLYTRSDNWFIYTNYISWISLRKNIILGISKDVIWKSSEYRTNTKLWSTGHLQTYLQELYLRIPIEYMLEYEDYYFWRAADRFIMYALIELAGNQHVKFIKYLPYFYTQPEARSACQWKPIQYDGYKSRLQTPLQPLESLDDPSQGIPQESYTHPSEVLKSYKKIKDEYRRCYPKANI